ncbi:MAG: protein kinase [Deltaproteobacteria bacterium]|nr:protein kinase [Deltaproteobacteria bacterium]
MLIGTTIAGKFVLREAIGSGGMGKVYSADQKGVGRTVAVKIMHQHLLGDETAAARFTNEARASSSLNHPHSIAVLDFGQTEVGMLYIVMEHLLGRSLDVLIDVGFPIALGRVARILCQTLEAVDAAHQQAIIHRDLKPENIFLLDQRGSQDFVKVLDFGIAKMLDIEDRSVTTPGLVPGTPEYMSPEQARGEKLDARSDVYSMGIILYELLTGTVPFRGTSAVATMMSHVQDPVEPPSERRPEVEIPASLESIVLWALAKNPEDRIVSATQFRDVVAAWARVSGVWVESAKDSSLPRLTVGEVSAIGAASVVDIEARVLEDDVDAFGPAVSAVSGFIGHDVDLDYVKHFIAGERPRALILRSGAGMGKSRLLDEVASYGQERGYEVFRCAPLQGWEPELLGVVQRLVLDSLHLQESDSAAILQAISNIDLDTEDVPGIEELFHLPTHLEDLPSDARRRERTAAFCGLMSKVAKRQPTLLVIEHFDRYDVPSRETLRALINAPSQDLVVVVSMATDETMIWGDAVEERDLSLLTPDQSMLLAQQMFDDAVPADLLAHIVKVGQGQPLFIEQAAFAVAHEGITDAPDRLGDLVAARIQRLHQEERSLLQWMAVYNDTVSALTLSPIIGSTVGPEDLSALATRGLLRRVDESMGKGRLRSAFAFAHHLVAMVVYSSIPAEVRRERHQAVAEYLRQVDAPVTTVAYHAYEADDGPIAVEELDHAGAWAMRCLDPKGAIRFYTDALDLVRREWGRGRVSAFDLDQTAVDLALRLAEVLRETNDSFTAEGVLGEVLSVAAGHDNDRARLRLELGRVDLDRGKLQRATRHRQLARADAQAADSPWILGEVTRELARAKGLMGERDEAGTLLFAALEESTRASGQRQGPSWKVLISAAVTSIQIAFPERARGYLLDALQDVENDRSLEGKLRIVIQMAALHESAGEWAEAEIRISQGVDLATQIGDRTSRTTLLLSLGRLRRISGDVERARHFLDEALLLANKLDWADGVMMVKQESELLRLAVPQSL